MEYISWKRRYVLGEGFYLDQITRRHWGRWSTEVTYGPFTYDELVDAAEWIVFGFLELALQELDS